MLACEEVRTYLQAMRYVEYWIAQLGDLERLCQQEDVHYP